jgi:hypothetical protein
MTKPATLAGYKSRSSIDFERVLVTLLRGLGPWKNSVYLVGGLEGKHGPVIRKALALLRKRFAHEGQTEGYLKDGPVAVAKFEVGEITSPRNASGGYCDSVRRVI